MASEFSCAPRALHVVLHNVRSINKNFYKLSDYLYTLPKLPQLIILTETWLKKYQTKFFQLPNYIRIDELRSNTRNNVEGGGVSIFIHHSIKILEYRKISSHNIEALEVIIRPDVEPICLHVIYRPPPPTVKTKKLIQFLEQLLQKPKKCNHHIILGDLNVDLLNPKRAVDIKAKNDLLNLIAVYGSSQLVDKPTRISKTTQTLIDHFITNRPDQCKIDKINHISGQDHSLIECLIFYKAIIEETTDPILSVRPHPNIKNIVNFANALRESHWQIMLDQYHPSVLLDLIETLTLDCVGTISGYPKPDKNYSSSSQDKTWLNPQLKELICRKNHLDGRVLLNPNNLKIRNQWRNLKRRVLAITRARKRYYIQRTCKKSTNINRDRWKILKKLNNIDQPNILPSGPLTETANAFADAWSSCATLNIVSSERQLIGRHFNISNDLFLFPASIQEIKNIINHLKLNTAPGIDGIHPAYIRGADDTYPCLLSHLINLIISSQEVPEKLKHTTIIPIYKKDGNKDDLNCYRPIAILTTFSKVFEKFLFQRINDFIVKRGIKHTSQHGFTKNKNKNTNTALEDI